MLLKVIIIIAMSVATGQRPLEYMRNSNDMSTADLLPMISYILGQAGSVEHDELGLGLKFLPKFLVLCF